MRELKVVEIRVSTGDAVPLVVLAEVGGRERLLPIWMSHGGASAIFSATEDPDPDRPAIHDLAWRLVEASGQTLASVRITSYADGQFFAELVLGEQGLPARASDAIALALRANCAIECADEVLDAAGVAAGESGPGGDAAPREDEVERFREFLDSVTPEDFTGEGGEQP